jgi:chemotaxis receptor (MCP) glutamine deamidase CheD
MGWTPESGIMIIDSTSGVCGMDHAMKNEERYEKTTHSDR